MNIFSGIASFFKRNKAVEKGSIETKSFGWGGFLDYLESYSHNDLAAHVAVDLFNRTSPLANSINILSEEVGSLIPRVTDENDEVVPSHPILGLLKTPNADSTTSEFLKKLTAFFEITGNTYLTGTGPVNKPPVEIWINYPQQINIMPDSFDGLASIITNQTVSAARDYKRHEVGSGFRFYYLDEAEIWQIKRFNPNTASLFGQSPASPIYPEIDQFNHASVHNSSLLKRGARPSGILLASSLRGASGEVIPPMTDDQFQRLKEQTTNYMQGAQNAGHILLAPGANMDYKDMMTSNRDMDYAELKKDNSNRIYNQFNIPLPFVNPERQTFANMGLAKEQLYDNAILPLADRIFNELSIFLLPRYPNSDNLRLTYDESKIPALRNRKVRQLNEFKKLGIFTDNELRAMLGREPYQGGDVIYKPGNEAPVGKDVYTGDEPATPKTTRKKFFEAMKAKGYSEEKIEKIAKGLKFINN